MTATEPIVAAAVDTAVLKRRHVASSALFSAYWALTKPEVTFLIAIATATAFWIGSPATLLNFPWFRLLNTILGTALVAGGAGTLNQWKEHRFDAKMRRTTRRPIAAGHVTPVDAFVFGTLLSAAGILYLFLAVLRAASLLALLTLGLYLLVYTPLKRRTPLCTLVGALPGAIPVLIGYIAAAGTLTPMAWLLFAVLFLWQFPHFMAIAWMYREDYARAGYMVLPIGNGRDRFVVWQSLIPGFALIPVGLISMVFGTSKFVWSAGIVMVDVVFLYYCARFAYRRSNVAARQLLTASIIYLPAVLLLTALAHR